MSSRGNDIIACNYLWIIIQGDSNRLTVFTPSIVSTKVFKKKKIKLWSNSSKEIKFYNFPHDNIYLNVLRFSLNVMFKL